MESNWTGLSDHLAQIIYFNKTFAPRKYHRKTNFVFKRQINKNSIKLLQNFLKKETGKEVYSSDNSVDSNYLKFSRIFQYHFELACPIIMKRGQSKEKETSALITLGILKSRQQLHNLIILKKLSSSRELSNFVANYKRLYRKVRRAAKIMHFDQAVSDCKNKTKTMWNIINNLLGKPSKSSIGS